MATCLLPRDDLAFARKRLCLQSHRGSPGKPVPIPSAMANFEQAGRAKSHEQQEKENSGSLGPWQQPRLRAKEAPRKGLRLLFKRRLVKEEKQQEVCCLHLRLRARQVCVRSPFGSSVLPFLLPLLAIPLSI